MITKIKQSISNYLINLKKEREEYTSYPNMSLIITKGIEYIFGTIVVCLLLLGNMFEKEVIKELQQSVALVLLLLVFTWMIFKLISAIRINRQDFMLGAYSDLIRTTVYTCIFFIFNLSLHVVVGDTMPTDYSKLLTSLMEVINLLIYLVIASVIVRTIIFILIMDKKKED